MKWGLTQGGRSSGFGLSFEVGLVYSLHNVSDFARGSGYATC